MLGAVWTLEEARSADQQAVASGVPYGALLAQAGLQLARFVQHRVPDGRVVVLTGPGSNGGDGWVAARHLARVRPVTVIPVAAPHFPDAENWASAARAAGVSISSSQQDLSGAAVVVDAIYGTGFHGAVKESPAGPWLKAVSERGLPVIHVDLPSGVDTNSGQYDGPELRSLATLTMGAAKWGLVSYPGAEGSGDLVVADIGLFSDHSTAHFTDARWAKNAAPGMTRTGHKYDRGHVVVIGGSAAMPGAPVLAGLAALGAGAGLVELVVPRGTWGRVAVSPALIVHGVEETADGSLRLSDTLVKRAARADALVIGPGLGPAASPTLLDALSQLTVPAVLDADGIRLYARTGAGLGPKWVFTPHAGEMGALLGKSAQEVNRNRRQALLDAVQMTSRAVLLKGLYSLIGSPTGPIQVNPTGSSALATAGSGDVLSGMVASLMAQGLTPVDALALACYWHGLAGELGEAERGISLTSVDLVDYLAPAWRMIQQEKAPSGVSFWR